MRKLERERTTDIPQAFRGQDRVKKTLELLKTQRRIKRQEIEKHSFPSNWSPAKEQLQKESYKKCAYCESPTAVIAYGDVEHYRPKSKYWWLAYCYDNYLASCQLCNQKFKKAKFTVYNRKLRGPRVQSNNTDRYLKNLAATITPDPIDPNNGLTWQEYMDKHHAERPLLLNPYIDDPSEYIAWEVDHLIGSVTMVAKDSTDDLQQQMIKAAEKDYGINRKELCSHRYDAYLRYTTARLTSEIPNIPDAIRNMNLDLYNRSIQPDAAYSGMVNYYDSLPSSELKLP